MNKIGSKMWIVGAALGAALVVSAAMSPTVGDGAADALKPGPIDPAVIAPAEQLGNAFAMVAAHVRPCVVSVYSEKMVKFTQPDFGMLFGDDVLRQLFGGQPSAQAQPQSGQREIKIPQRGMGSGMIVDKKGHILTNFHVVKDVDEIKVQLADKRQFEAEIVGTDRQTDVAIIRIKGTVPDDLPTVTLGNSVTARPGNLVMAIGAPFGLAQTVTEGIISATGRSDMGIEDYEDFLQTDAPINPGNSGGPLVNMRGEVIGMNTAIATGVGESAGVGFAIPSDMIRTMLPKLMAGEIIVRGQLGVVIQNVTEDLRKQFGLSGSRGALVSQVNKGSAAEKAGIKVGDVIVRYDGHDVLDVSYLHNLIGATIPGTVVELRVNRDGKEQAIKATIGKQEHAAAAANPSAEGASLLTRYGLRIQTLTAELAKQFGMEATKGAVITDVAIGSLASTAGLQKGDVITEADRQAVETAADVETILGKAKDKDTALLLVNRQGTDVFVVLQMR